MCHEDMYLHVRLPACPQLLCTFSAIHRSSVIMVLCWVSAVPAVLDVLLGQLLLGQAMGQDIKPALAIGVSATGGSGLGPGPYTLSPTP